MEGDRAFDSRLVRLIAQLHWEFVVVPFVRMGLEQSCDIRGGVDGTRLVRGSITLFLVSLT